ncbi:hypothetical protein D3C80_953250 [compost metagenome]
MAQHVKTQHGPAAVPLGASVADEVARQHLGHPPPGVQGYVAHPEQRQGSDRQDEVAQPLGPVHLIRAEARRPGAADRQQRPVHREQRQQQQADPEGGQRGEQVTEAADEPVRPAVEITAGAQAEQDAGAARQQPGPRQQQEGGSKALANDLGDRRVVEHGVAEIPLQHLAEPVPVAQPQRLIQPPASGNAGVLRRGHVQQIVADIGLDGIDGGVAEQHKGRGRHQAEQPRQPQQGFAQGFTRCAQG